MGRDEIAVVGILGIVFLLALAVVLYVGDADYGDATFRARPGTERERSLPFTSERDLTSRQDPEDVLPRRLEVREADRLQEQTVEIREHEPLEPSEQVIARALSIVEPGAAERMVEEILRVMRADPGNPELYNTLGYLQLQLGPEQLEAAMTAFTDAMEAADGVRQTHRAALEGARKLTNAGQYEKALALAEEALTDEAPLHAERLQLHLLKARVYKELDDADAVESAYRGALDAADAHEGRLDPELEKVYRQACLHLSRWYREHGRGDEAEAVMDSMNARVR